MVKSFGTERYVEVLSEATLDGSVEGSPEEDMIVSDGGIMEGKKRRRKGGKELTEKVPVSDGKSGRRFSAQRSAPSVRTHRD